jgi:hypothetical protein
LGFSPILKMGSIIGFGWETATLGDWLLGMQILPETILGEGWGLSKKHILADLNVFFGLFTKFENGFHNWVWLGSTKNQPK